MTASAVRTLEEVFDHVTIFPAFDPAVGDGAGNLEIIAYDGELRSMQLTRVNDLTVHPLAKRGVTLGMRTPFVFPENTPTILLTDDYNPMDFYDLWLKEDVRKGIVDSTDFDILLG